MALREGQNAQLMPTRGLLAVVIPGAWNIPARFLSLSLSAVFGEWATQRRYE
jgi:hypothetical protein